MALSAIRHVTHSDIHIYQTDKGKQEIRLLTLLPSQSLHDSTRIAISHLRFTWGYPKVNRFRESFPYPGYFWNEIHEPEFETLSHTWGSNAKSEIAYVMNRPRTPAKDITSKETPGRRLEITQNLSIALKHLRHVD
jgi:hypothetical protein